jgi:fructose-1,6-bisphosphatase/sedoheptulose 1,7-bisphosphatase-like protein
MQARLKFRNEQEVQRAREMGVEDIDRVFTEKELARGDDIMFAATGVTNGDLLKGVQFKPGGALTHSIVMRARTRTVRFLETHHSFVNKPAFDQF